MANNVNDIGDVALLAIIEDPSVAESWAIQAMAKAVVAERLQKKEFQPKWSPSKPLDQNEIHRGTLNLTNNIEIEAWYEPLRELVNIKARRCPTGDIRDGKQGVRMQFTLGSMFDIAEGEIYPLICNHDMRRQPSDPPLRSLD